MRETVDRTIAFSLVLGWISWTNIGLKVLFPKGREKEKHAAVFLLKDNSLSFPWHLEEFTKEYFSELCLKRLRNT